MSHGRALPAVAVVLRVMAPKPQFAPVEAHAPADAFRPNSGDKEQAKKTGEPVRVSVWDQALTSLAQIHAMRGLAEAYTYRLAVDDVTQLAQSLPHARLRVVYEVLDEPLRSRPGAEGHGGIEGLDRLPGEANDLYQERLRQIAKLARFAPLPARSPAARLTSASAASSLVGRSRS